MSLLDDARRLAERNALAFVTDTGAFRCIACPAGVVFDSDEELVHSPRCPSLALPRIVAVLEAAERLIVPYDGEPSEYARSEDAHFHAFCERPIGQGHEPDCAWQALVAALRGDDAQAPT